MVNWPSRADGLQDRAKTDGASYWCFREIPIAIFIWVVVKIMVPYLGTLNMRCCIILGIQEGTIILTTTHMSCSLRSLERYMADDPGSIIAVSKEGC